jgi:tetratricopeptide (TPR) repeat protein
MVLTPSPEPQVFDVRHGYLHYLLDPLSIKYADELKKRKGLGDYALPAPALEDYYKSDFLLLATECLIKAVESRLDKKPAAVDQALSEGYILTPHFAEQLLVYEKQEQSMRLFYPEMVTSISLRKEEKRLENVQFAAQKPTRKAKVVPAERRPELPAAYKTLEQAETEAYSNKNLEKAKQLYRRVLEQSDEKPLHARSYYGLARIAAMERDPELAEKLFQKTLECSPNPQTEAWAHVYLARLADAAGEREQAVQHYKAAAGIAGASTAAHDAAEKGLQQAFQNK